MKETRWFLSNLLKMRNGDFFHAIRRKSHGVKNNLGQMKIQQTAFMLIAVTIFLVLAGMFVLIIKFSGLKESAGLLEEKEAMLLVTKLANSPEFSCGESFGTAKTNCIDFDKAFALKKNVGNYENFWGVSGIEIRKIYPENSKECTDLNYPECGFLKVLPETKGTAQSNFVTICKKEYLEDSGNYDKCEIGRLLVYYEKK